MPNDFKPIELLPSLSEQRQNPTKPKTLAFARSRSVPVGPAQRREIPEIYLTIEPKPISAYDNNPVFDERNAARLIGVTAHCLKKWRQRKQGPDYIQYGHNGPIRYELNTLMDFREKYRVTLTGRK